MALPPERLKRFQDVHLPQHVFTVRIPFPSSRLQDLFDPRPGIVFVPERLHTEAADVIKALGNVISVATTESLAPGRVGEHWQLLHNAFGLEGDLLAKPSNFFSGQAGVSWLPTHFVARSLNGGRDVDPPHPTGSLDNASSYSIEVQARLAALFRLGVLEGRSTSTSSVSEDELNKDRTTFRCPVTVGIPGAPPHSGPRALMKIIKQLARQAEGDAEIERSVLEFMVAHRALSRGGMGLLSAKIGDDAFVMLKNLETHWKDATQWGNAPKSRYIWTTLQKFGAFVAQALSQNQIIALRHANFLECFSEFPIGLAILPGDSAPLACHFPIAYRPLIPLTRALIFEIGIIPFAYLNNKLRILIVECLLQDDRIGPISRNGWQHIKDYLASTPGVTITIVEVEDAQKIKDSIAADQYDILVISAHGGIDQKTNRTGFRCGKNLVGEEELGNVPPIVCLSACQVSPRGHGTVNISDLLFRRGARMVLGTLVPVDVRHNALLMGRLFANLAKAVCTGDNRFKTFQDVWHFTATTNALHDILAGNESMRIWASEKKNGQSVIDQCFSERASGKLRPTHIYDDTVALLKEIAHEERIEGKFDSWLANPGFVPESIFYAILGWPDRVVFGKQPVPQSPRSEQKQRGRESF